MSDRARTVLTDALLRWGRAEQRDLPWRLTRDPWAVLVSEVMLQQTQVDRVIPRYEMFMERFPTAPACASASAGDVIALWSGLGYNRRAVNLWRAASAVTREHDGVLPDDLDALLSLPGVGPYTARAVLAFAFERDVGVVDTNVGRLLARWTGETLTAQQAQRHADDLVPRGSGWAWNQALFDFANAICLKRNPRCDVCPVRARCAWQGSGPDPAIASAGVSTGQSRFEGSERQVRGRVVDALRGGPLSIGDVMEFARPGDTEAEMDSIIAGLVDDGLIVERSRTLQLPRQETTGI